MKLIDEKRANAPIVLPVVGEVKFDKDGCIEVSDEEGEALLEAKIGLRKFGSKSDAQENAEAQKNAKQKQLEDAVNNIKSMETEAELHELCTSAQIPNEEWSTKSVLELKLLLIKKVVPKGHPAIKEAEQAVEDLKAPNAPEEAPKEETAEAPTEEAPKEEKKPTGKKKK